MAAVLQDETYTVAYGTGLTLSASKKYIVHGVTTASAAYGAAGGGIGDALTFGTATGYLLSKQVALVGESGGNVWTVTDTWSTPTNQAPADTSANYSASVGGTFVDVWRTGVTLPTSGTPSGTDIGGTKVDSAGVPVSTFITQSTISRIRQLATVPWTSIWGAVGKRNSDAFDGAAIGQLLFKGVQVSMVQSGLFQVTYEFMGDQHLHLRQVCTREADQKPKGDGTFQALEVKFIQPFPSTTSFSTLIAATS